MTEIANVKISRFKQLKNFDLPLKDNTLLIGANNSGKSSVLQALHFAVSVAQSAKLFGTHIKWSTDKFQLSFDPAQLIYSPIADVMSLAPGGNLIEKAGEQIEIEIATSDGETCVVAVRRGRNKNMQVSLTGRVLGERLMSLEKPFTIYAPGLAGIPKEERYMSPGVVRRIVARGDANLVLRNVILMLSLNKVAWDSFMKDMGAIFDKFSMDIVFDEQRDETIEVFFTADGSPRLPIDAAGTSILQTCQILAYINLFDPQVLILDEPDSHLHPNNQRLLCNRVVELSATKSFRALISTHSRHVLDAMRERSSVLWVNKGEKVPYDSVTVASQLLEMGALDSIDYFAKGKLSCLFATEDSSSESIAALNCILDSNGFVLADTEIKSYSGCSKIDSAKVLQGFLADKAPKVRFVLHRDRDYMEDELALKFEKQIAEIGALPFLTTYSDVENYFLNAEHLSLLNPELPVAQAEELIDQATLSTRKKSIESLTNIRYDAANRNRKEGKQPNAGAIAIKAQEDYDADPLKWRRGKIVLKELKGLLHKALGKDPVIQSKSDFLKIPELTKIKVEIWGQAKGKEK